MSILNDIHFLTTLLFINPHYSLNQLLIQSCRMFGPRRVVILWFVVIRCGPSPRDPFRKGNTTTTNFYDITGLFYRAD